MILADYILWRVTSSQMNGPYTGIFYVIGFALLTMAVVEMGDRIRKRNKRNKDMAVSIEKISHTTTRALIDALQRGDVAKWKSLFSPGAKLFDDGNPRDLGKFTTDALGHERFTSIDKIENNGLNITGHFHSDRWGDFVTYFKITVNEQHKIVRLDIGQV